jgi:ComF family protein
MTINIVKSFIRPVIKSVINIIPQHCLFCLEKTHTTMALCASCIAHLEMNAHCCQRCALPLEESIEQSVLLCGNCLSHDYFYDKVYSPFVYSEEISYLIKKLKYQQKIHYAHILATLFIEKTPLLKSGGQNLPDMLIPIPMHSKRLKQRGFNQALEISRILATHYQIPLNYKHLIRSRYTALQAGMGSSQRQKNIRHAFHLQQPLKVEHVALIDDVMTTGCTVNEVAKLLKNEGVNTVDIWVIARAGLHH